MQVFVGAPFRGDVSRGCVGVELAPEGAPTEGRVGRAGFFVGAP